MGTLTLEMPRPWASNEYPQYMFCGEERKILDTPLFWSYDAEGRHVNIYSYALSSPVALFDLIDTVPFRERQQKDDKQGFDLSLKKNY